MKAIILLGAPGAGKGTVAEGIKSATSYIHVSTGDMLREAVKANTPVGVKADAYMKRGDLVPDELIVQIVMDRMDRGGPDSRYMFDGFPRTLEQARLLDEHLEQRKDRVTRVFLLEAPRDVTIDRLTGRRICRTCGANYHIRNIPPKKAGVCDRCGGELYQRQDDREETIINRLEVFKKQTASLIEYYEKKGVLMLINSAKPREQTIREILKALGEAAVSSRTGKT